MCDVLFVGKLIPLHGVDTILAAAALVPELSIRIVGDGQLASLLADLPANVAWKRWVAYEGLPEAYRRAGCALGIFGTCDKARRVVPNKVYQALATATALVTADTPAARELLRTTATRCSCPRRIRVRSQPRFAGSPAIRLCRRGSARRAARPMTSVRRSPSSAPAGARCSRASSGGR